MCCCSSEREWKEENLTDGAILEDRSCTDCCCIPIFTIFLALWFVVLGIAISYGDPNRILLPSNFEDRLCGDTDLVDYPNLFIPLPNRIEYGICVKSCPSIGSYVCNNVVETEIGGTAKFANTHYDHTEAEFSVGKSALSACASGSCTAAQQSDANRFAGLLKKLGDFKCFYVFYKTGPTLNRCLPFDFDTSNKTFLELANESSSTLSTLADTLGFGSFFARGFAEVKQCWISIAICCATAAVLSIIWIMLLRWILAPIVYTVILLIFLLFIVIGVLALLQANNLEDVKLPGDDGTESQVQFFRAIEYICFGLAAVYVVLVIVVIKRIRIAIILMEESSKAFTANPGLVILPPIVIVLLCGFIALFIVVAVYIQTIGNLTASEVTAAIVRTADSYVNVSEIEAAAGAAYGETNLTDKFNISKYDAATSNKALHAYNFFMFLWAANILMMFAFFVMAAVVCTWYFSATGVEMDKYESGDSENGRMKETKVGTMCRAVCIAFRYHLGTILFGALLIAIIQFIRAVVLYIEQQYLQKWKNNATAKVLLYILNCCLECIERLVKIISKSAFVITIVKNSNFCSSAFQAIVILFENIVRVGTLTTLSTISCFLIKMFIVGCNMIIGYGLMQVSTVNDSRDVESGLFPLIGILFATFIIATLFVSVFEACVDTIMICFFIDEKDFEGRFLPPNLAKLVDKFSHIEKARKEYESQLATTTSHGEEPTKQ